MEITEEMQAQIDTAVKAAVEAAGLNEIVSKMRHGDPDPSEKSLGWTGGKPAGEEDDFPSLGHNLVAIAKAQQPGGQIDNRLLKQATGLREAIPADGGYLIQTQFVTQLLETVHRTALLPARCTKIPIGANFNGLTMIGLDEVSRATGSRWGGIQAFWAAEGATKTPSQPKFRRMRLDLEKMIGMFRATDELLQDYTALQAMVSRWFSLEFGFKLDESIITGTGAGQMLGILNSGALVTVDKEPAQAARTIVTENILKMYQAMHTRSRANAVWLYNQECEAQLSLLVLGSGAAASRLFDPAAGTLMGKPAIAIEQAEALGNKGDIMLVDLSQYLLIDKGGIDAASSIHVRFENDETAFRFVYRVNGQPMWDKPLDPFKGTLKTSPFVTLAPRI